MRATPENADHNVGRVLDAIEELGELDEHARSVDLGRNGASMEGTITGSFNELTMQNGIPLTDEKQLQLAERRRHRGMGRTDAGAALLGRVGVGGQHAVSAGESRWARISAARATRSSSTGPRDQGGRALAGPTYSHVIDIGAHHPRDRRHPDADPHRRDRAAADARCTFADSLTDADAPERHTQQYFETIGNRAMYKDGWWLSMKTARIPWVLDARGPEPSPQVLEPRR